MLQFGRPLIRLCLICNLPATVGGVKASTGQPPPPLLIPPHVQLNASEMLYMATTAANLPHLFVIWWARKVGGNCQQKTNMSGGTTQRCGCINMLLQRPLPARC